MTKQEFVNKIKEVEKYGIDLPKIFLYVLYYVYHYTILDPRNKRFNSYVFIKIDDFIKGKEQ